MVLRLSHPWSGSATAVTRRRNGEAVAGRSLDAAPRKLRTDGVPASCPRSCLVRSCVPTFQQLVNDLGDG